MALPSWPVNLPCASSRDAWSIAESGQAPLASEMQSGRVRQRPISRFRIAKMTMTLAFTTAQLAVFRSFVQTDLGMGCSRFTMPVLDKASNAYVTRTVMIVNGLNGISEKDAVAKTQVSFTLMVEML